MDEGPSEGGVRSGLHVSQGATEGVVGPGKGSMASHLRLRPRERIFRYPILGNRGGAGGGRRQPTWIVPCLTANETASSLECTRSLPRMFRMWV
jgi:hypothetical protein